MVLPIELENTEEISEVVEYYWVSVEHVECEMP